MFGVHVKPYVPIALVVVVPIGRVLPFWSMTVKVTLTPVVLVGIGCCMYTASINWLMLASDTHGKPLGKFAATASCFEPAEMSITEPVIVIGVAVVTPMLGAVTVVCAWSFADKRIFGCRMRLVLS